MIDIHVRSTYYHTTMWMFLFHRAYVHINYMWPNRFFQAILAYLDDLLVSMKTRFPEKSLSVVSAIGTLFDSRLVPKRGLSHGEQELKVSFHIWLTAVQDQTNRPYCGMKLKFMFNFLHKSLLSVCSLSSNDVGQLGDCHWKHFLDFLLCRLSLNNMMSQ